MRIVYSCLICRNLTTGENPVCTKDHQLWRYRSQDERLLAAYPRDTCFDYIPSAVALDPGVSSPSAGEAIDATAVPNTTMCCWQEAEDAQFDEDGLGACRGAWWGFVLTVALFGLTFMFSELLGLLSVNAKVGLIGLFIAAVAGWRAYHLFQTWRDWKGYLTLIVPGVLTFAWSIFAWGW